MKLVKGLRFEELLRLEPRCRVCDCILNEENWSRREGNICRECSRAKARASYQKKKKLRKDKK